jgi:hypothetical protein
MLRVIPVAMPVISVFLSAGVDSADCGDDAERQPSGP